MKIFKALIFTAIITIFSFTLTGCGGKEPNEIAYVVALGIDSGDNDNYKITLQYANPTQISGGSSEEGGKSGSQIVENIVVEAPNIYSAMGIANNIISKSFSLAHAKLIIFSDEVAEEGLRDITETFIRSDEIRPDIYLAIAVDGASEYLTSINPAMEINPVKYYQMIFNKNNLMGLPEGVAKNFFFGIETGDFDTTLPVAGIIGSEENSSSQSQGSGGSNGGEGKNGDSGGKEEKSGGLEGEQETGGQSQEGGGTSEGSSDSGEPQENTKHDDAPINDKGFEYKMRSYIDGESAVEASNKSEAMGSAIFEGDKMVGMFGSIETEIFKILIGDYKSSYLTFYSEKTPENPITLKCIQDRCPKYDIDIDKKTVDIELFMEGDVYSLPSDYIIEEDIVNFEENSKKYIEEGCKEFMTEFIKNHDSDIFRLKNKAKRKFLTNEKYEEFKNNVDFREYEINVKANFKVRRTGLVVRGS